jgi:pimeloyl-ACP methyl ester carboxylesterase
VDLPVPDSGHATNYDQLALFNRAVLDFLASY